MIDKDLLIRTTRTWLRKRSSVVRALRDIREREESVSDEHRLPQTGTDHFDEPGLHPSKELERIYRTTIAIELDR